MSCLSGGSKLHFDNDFFESFDQNICAIDDYGYAGGDFQEDLDLVLLEGDEWDRKIGEKDNVFSLWKMLFYFIFCLFWGYNMANCEMLDHILCTGATCRDVSYETERIGSMICSRRGHG